MNTKKDIRWGEEREDHKKGLFLVFGSNSNLCLTDKHDNSDKTDDSDTEHGEKSTYTKRRDRWRGIFRNNTDWMDGCQVRANSEKVLYYLWREGGGWLEHFEDGMCTGGRSSGDVSRRKR